MIIDLDQCQWTELRCDLCVIGAGAAGITIAREFAGSRHSVVVLEGGGNEVEPASQEPYRSLITALPHQGTHMGRARAVGGTTTLWAGQALPLFVSDFEYRPWVPFSGWPITREALLPYYERAEGVMRIPHATYDERSWPRPVRPLFDDGCGIGCSYSQFATEPNFAKKYRALLATSDNVQMLTHANAVSLNANVGADAIESVSIRSFQSKHAVIRAACFVVCCGGIDSARLMLASNSVERDGIGNRHGNVGRFFQDHPTVKVPIRPRHPASFDATFSAVRERSPLRVIKLHPTPDVQRAERILNVGAELVHDDPDGDSVAAAFRVAGQLRRGPFAINRTTLRDLNVALRDPPAVTAALARKLVRRRGRSSKRLRHSLLVSSEQNPTRDSRITLSAQTDSVGMPRAVICWKLDAMVSHTVESFLRRLAARWSSLGIADIKPNDISTNCGGPGAGQRFTDVNHHMGTTRMGTDPTCSVVDPSCRVHGYRNLYIASSSVFPTSGFSNPTLTVLALSCRLADEIKRREFSVGFGDSATMR